MYFFTVGNMHRLNLTWLEITTSSAPKSMRSVLFQPCAQTSVPSMRVCAALFMMVGSERFLTTSPTPATTHGNHQGGRSIGSKKKVRKCCSLNSTLGQRVTKVSHANSSLGWRATTYCLARRPQIRHHVNPLKDVHMQKLDLPERWPEHKFARPELPLHVDVGCARGVFCLDLAASSDEANVLGLEIRAPLAEAATDDARELGLGNAAFLACNANSNLEQILSLADACSPLRSVSIQFPDPWFKVRHHKRRVVQPDLVRTIASHLQPGGWLFVQTDVLDLAESARQTIRETVLEASTGMLLDSVDDVTDWSAPKPPELLAVGTERERASEALGRPIYRTLFRKPVEAQ